MYKNFNSVVKGHDDNNYLLFAKEKIVIIPIKTMHRMCTFDGLTDSKGFIKNGVRLNLVEIKTDCGTVYYPNHEFYLNNYKKEDNPSIVIASFPIKPFSYGIESEYLEFKESFSCKNGIRETLISFANSGHEGTLLVGVNDEGFPMGLRCVIRNEQKKLIDNLRNEIKLGCNNLEFAQSLQITWEVKAGKTVCKIHVPVWSGNILFLHKDKLYVRMGSTNQRLTGNDIVRFIEERCQKSA